MSVDPTVVTQSGERTVAYEIAKRVVDLTLGMLLFLVLLPLMLLIALAIRLSSPGPVLFRQVRVGRNDREFFIFKFRTMAVGSDKAGPQVTSADDGRVTRLGRYLRALKLDEFPQLLNVIRGEMSLVGPRPQVPRYVDRFDPKQRKVVLGVRPGITGPTQLRFRNEESLLEGRTNREQYYIDVLLPIKCNLDVEYVRNRSLVYDARVFLTTIGMFGRGMINRIIWRARRLPQDAVVEVRGEERTEARDKVVI